MARQASGVPGMDAAVCLAQRGPCGSPLSPPPAVAGFRGGTRMARGRDSCFLQPPPLPLPADWGRHHAPGCPAHLERTAPRSGSPPRPRLLSHRCGADSPACSGEDHACLPWGPSCSRTFPLPQGVFMVCKAPRSGAEASSQRPRGSAEPQSPFPSRGGLRVV